MIAYKRREQILYLLQMYNQLSVTQFADLLNVSESTIQRDLSSLIKEQKLRLDKNGNYISFIPLSIQYRDEIDHDLAKRAVTLIDNGDSIFLDNGSLIPYMYILLRHRPVIIITNCLQLQQLIHPDDQARIFFGSGCYHADTQDTHGSEFSHLLDRFHFNKTFVTAEFMDRKTGMCYCNALEKANNRRHAMRNSDISILMINKQSLNQNNASLVFAESHDFDNILMFDDDSSIQF